MLKISRHRLAVHIAKQLAEKSAPNTLAQQVAAYLLDNHQSKQVDMLLSDVTAVLAKDYGAVTAKATTAYPLTNELRNQVVSFIKQHENAKSVELQEIINHDIIGGVIIQTPSAQFDNTVKTQIKYLRNNKETRE